MSKPKQVKTTKPKESKYKAGQWLAAPGLRLLHIEDVLETESLTLYALRHHDSDSGTGDAGHLHWFTKQEIDEQLGRTKAKAITPNWHKFDEVKAGDVIAAGPDNEELATVLVRANNTVLLSEHYSARATRDAKDMLKDLDGAPGGLPPQLLSSAQRQAAGRAAFNRAGNWYTLKQMVVMNWTIFSNDEGGE